MIDTTGVSTIDSTGFGDLPVLRDELARRGVEIWSINPSVQKRALIDQQAEVLDVTPLRRFQTQDDALAAYRQLDAPGPRADGRRQDEP